MAREPIALRSEELFPGNSRTLVFDEETSVSVSLHRLPAGDSGELHTYCHGHGVYVLSGMLDTNFGLFDTGSFVWFEPGSTVRYGAPSDQDVSYLVFTDGSFGADDCEPCPSGVLSVGVTLLRPEDMILAYRSDDARRVYGRLTLHEGGPTGMEIKLQHFEPGCMTRWHTHHCAHGAWVLAGTYHTSVGDFGPGSFVWFPEGMRMEHGTVDEPCDLLFITNKSFDIEFG